MRRTLTILLLLGSLASALAGEITGRVIKVLPLLLDRQGQNAVSPSLYDRDAYQAYLRKHPGEISAVRYDVLWKAADAEGAKIRLRVELQGVSTNDLPRAVTLEQAVVPGFFRRWTSLTLAGEDYKSFRAITAWRVTLWSDGRLLGEQKSFLWPGGPD